MTDHLPATRRSVLGLAAALAGPALPVAAQLIPPASDKPVTITWYNYNLASAGIGAEATKELIAEFTAAHPHIKVEGVPVSAEQIISRVQADLAAGRVPDVAQLIFSDLDFIVRNFGVKPLDDIIPRAEWAEHTAGMVPAGLKLGVLEGKVYGLAYVFSTPVLFYNADLFRAAGLNPDAPPADWAAVKSAALQLKERTGKHGFYATIYGSFDWALQGIYRSNGGRALSEDRKRIAWGEPDAVASIAVFRDLYKSGAHPNISETEAPDLFMSGNLGMLLTTSVYTRAFQNAARDKFMVNASAMPAFAGRPAAPTNSGSALFILSRDPAKQRASWELLKFMTSRRGYTIITSKIGYLPLRLDIVDDPAFLGPWTQANPLIRPNLAQLERLEQWQSFPGPNYRQIQRIQMTAVNEAVYGDVAAVMREAQERAQGLMPR